MTKKKISEAVDQATALHNALTQLSQTVPPQVNMTNVLSQSESLQRTLEEVGSETTASHSTASKTKEHA